MSTRARVMQRGTSGTLRPVPNPSAHPDRLPDDPQWLKGEVKRLRLMVQKLKPQLARQQRARFSASSERHADGQASLIKAELALSERPAARSSKPAPAAADLPSKPVSADSRVPLG